MSGIRRFYCFLTSTSRSFSVTEEDQVIRIKGIEDGDQKVWGQEVLHPLCLMSGKLIEKYGILCTISMGGMRQSQLEPPYNGIKSAES